ncbi:blast:Forkhead box protein N3 [Drosophila guanche]|uniref:Blast:Forkhead box protein N3 n=2 Tax=Drosophila guanche TaxID=7266 RepID=A0A3B0J7U4_DROGU|nr:blast:Forkhead box protein N3 [Drosophila guanche]
MRGGKNKIMSTDNPAQVLTTRDLGQLRGHLQTTAAPAPASAPSAVHGYRSVIPPPIRTSATATAPVAVASTAAPVSTASSIIAAAASSSSTTSTSNSSSSSINHGGGNMQATSSKYVVLQPNHNGGFTAYDSSATAVTTTPTGGGGAGTGGNIVLLAAEPLEMGSADALAAAAAAAAGADDGELRSLSWLSDSNLIKGIVTSSGATTAASQAKRTAAVALKAPAAVCHVGDLIEELPACSIDMVETGEQQGTPGGVYSTTTVHKGPSGTTTVVEYKATKTTTTMAPRTSYMPVVVTSSSSSNSNTPAAAQATISPAKQQPQQLYVTSNGTGATTFKTSSPTSMATVSVSSALPCSPNNNNSNHHNTTTHHPHKKYLREKMNVHVDHSNHVASTVTVVSSPASSNNSSLSSTSTSASASASSMSVNGSSGGSNGAGNSPGPKAASSYTTVYETVKFSGAGTMPWNTSSSNPSSSNSNRQHLPEHSTLITTTGLITASPLTGGYSFVNNLAGSTHVISSTAPTETALGGGGSIYYTNATPMQQQQQQQQQQHLQQQQQQRGMHVSVSPPPPPINATMGNHNGSGLNLRSPNSYSSYENEDSLKEFDMTVNSRMHTSTPQYVVSAPKNSSYSNNANNASNGAGGGAGAGSTTQKQKHPNNVPYDPLVHTNNKPPYSFSSLIFMAIEGSNEKALPVKEIYAWIVQHFPYFKTAPNGWKNSVRHNLSLNKSFVKVEKAPNMGKGSLWRVEPQQRQNLIQALNRSPFFPNSAVDKISTSLKSPSGHGAAQSSGGYDVLDGVAAGAAAAACGNSTAPVALATPTKSNGLVLANGGASQSAAMPTSPLSSAGGGGGSASHARVDPKLFPYLSKAFRKIREDGGPPTRQLLLGDVYDDDVSADYAGNQNHNSSSNGNGNGNGNGTGTGGRCIYVGNGGAAAPAAAGPTANGDGINFERLARDCGADSMDDVHAAAAMLFLKHGPKAFTESFQNGAPVITSSPSEDHTYSAGGNSNADSGASTPLMNGNILAGQTPAQMQLQAQANVGGGSDSNCASSDAAYDSSEENHNITPEELADQQRHRDGVDALLSLSRSSIVECGSVATTHYHSNGSSGSSHGSPHKRPSSHSLEEDHEHHLLQQYQPLLSSTPQSVYSNGSGSKMALLSSAAANVALAQQQQQQHQIHQMQQQQQQHQMQQQHTELFGSVNGSYLAGGQAAMLPQHLTAAMANAAAIAAAAVKNKVKPVRGLRTKIKRKSAWMR